MALFDFELARIEEIAPWGTPPDLNLSWYSLTGGAYHMNLGGQQLFRYSDEIVALWKTQYPNSENSPFVESQIVRLWEDILELLPDIITPLPDALIRFVETSKSQARFKHNLLDLLGYRPTDDEIKLYFQATDWFHKRQLTSQHLREGPEIRIFRFEDDITIRWSSVRNKIDGIQPWSSPIGEEKFTATAFIAEVQSFHDRLMDAMAVRIELLLHDNPIPSVHIDLDALVEEQYQRKGRLKQALNRVPQIVDQEIILGAMSKLKNGSK